MFGVVAPGIFLVGSLKKLVLVEYINITKKKKKNVIIWSFTTSFYKVSYFKIVA